MLKSFTQLWNDTPQYGLNLYEAQVIDCSYTEMTFQKALSCAEHFGYLCCDKPQSCV